MDVPLWIFFNEQLLLKKVGQRSVTESFTGCVKKAMEGRVFIRSVLSFIPESEP
jgi:hypothetical protein